MALSTVRLSSFSERRPNSVKLVSVEVIGAVAHITVLRLKSPATLLGKQVDSNGEWISAGYQKAVYKEEKATAYYSHKGWIIEDGPAYLKGILIPS